MMLRKYIYLEAHMSFLINRLLLRESSVKTKVFFEEF